ncbi:MAG: malonyl-ACP O-methyltransferase BioC [Proteobacteria bacterium]|uniref:malonyl-ACP O-methyltransferase BioC n=1 Tax=Rudaea sp. TaxID=2136325 RepID=UPI001D4CC068|nr:malonyl-ACP O-methyltransferase BioC [Pseudomonadota bacterium]MBS0568793.1 malonyl-ACP O-methyltransferase BioC [Pseudomonadota bacterium]
MTPPFDARQVRHAFGRAAASYEANAVLQREVGQRLLERLDYVAAVPARVLDLGCGPGHAAQAMRARWKGAQVIALDVALPMLDRVKPNWLRPLARVNADARALPLAEASVDVLFSNLCIQWIDDLPALFEEFRRVLRPGGYLAVSTFGPDTLRELRAAWAQVDRAPRVNVFADIARIGDALMHAGFRDPVLDGEHFTLTYHDATTLMRELKAIGATNADPQRARGLTGRSRHRRAVAAYEAFRSDGLLPATYEVIYAHAWAPDSGQPRRGRGGGEIASFPIERLRGSRR